MNVVYPAVAFFLLVLSIFGLIFCFRVDEVDYAYCNAIKNIITDTFNVAENGFRKYVGFLLVRKHKAQAVGRIYEGLYLMSIFIWVCLFFHSIYGTLLSIISTAIN